MSGNTRETNIVMPQLAESVVDATISKWLKQPGDSVEEYEPICEIITDKVTAELPSTEAGTMGDIIVGEGETVDVGTVICTLFVANGEGEQVGSVEVHGSESSVESDGPADSASGTQQAGLPADQGAKQAGHSTKSAASAQKSQSMAKRYSPAVRTLAEEHDINLEDVPGTGLGGRVTRKDVLAFIAEPAKQTNQATPAQAQPTNDVVRTPVRSTGLHLDPGTPKRYEPTAAADHNEYYIDVNPIRNTIASRMRQSVSEIPHAWTMIEVDVTNLVLLRSKLKEEFAKQEGVNLTYLSFIIKAVVSAIKDYPILNSVWAVDKIIVKRDINISLAVGTEDAVYVPVIKQADQKNIAGIAREIDSLTKKARSGKLAPDDMQNGTFTVNNTGSFGSILSQPIISYPQAANLTFESIVKKPVVIDDMIAVRSMVNICLSLDHRILDGVICGRFLQRVKENIESYGPDTKLY